MSEDNTYCRLCAEPTPLEQLVSADDDVGLNSKISTKMKWINIDVNTSNTLPNTICFACFDALEKTWVFLHNVRTAQVKLHTIYSIKVSPAKNTSKTASDDATEVGKPVDENWEDFHEAKSEVKLESFLENGEITLVDTPFNIKAEPNEDDVQFNSLLDNSYNTSDSDLPLHLTVKKKKIKKKKKLKYKHETEIDLDLTEEVIPIEITSASMTWDDYTWRCAECDAQFMNITSLQLHAQQIHSACCVFKCSDCDKVITTFKSFINHVRVHKKLLQYCCEICNKCFNTPNCVKQHLNTHKSLKQCQSCGSNFETKKLLLDHILIYTKGYKSSRDKSSVDLKCEHCNKEFKSRSNLQQHKLVHTERAREFSCHICGKMFFTKGTLGAHMMTHDDTKPYKCEFCPMAFRARGNLQSHISLHSGAKPFVCEQCGKSFRVKRHLKSHSIVHTDLMPYVCEYCNKTFRFKTRLNLHIRQHTGAKPYSCIYCQRDFTNGSNFKKHMKRRHNIDTSRKKFNTVVSETENITIESNGNQSQNSV